MVNTDGTAYLEYEVRNTVNNVVTSDTLYLMQINPDNSSSSTILSATTQNETQYPGNIIPDGNGGVLATWSVSVVQGTQPTYPYEAVDVSGGAVGAPYTLPFSPQSVDITKQPVLVLGESGVAFAKGRSNVLINGVSTTVDQIASFNISSGEPNWTDQGTTGTTLSLIEATSGNGLAAKSTDQTGTDTVLIFSPGGTPSSMARRQTTWLGTNSVAPADSSSGLSQTDYYSNGLWVGASGGGAEAEVGLLIQAAMSSYPHEKGNNSRQSSKPPVIENFETVDPQAPGGNTAATFVTRYNATVNYPANNANGVSLGTLTHANFSTYGGASFSNYVTQVFKPIDAVAFIGHSITDPSGSYAVGLCFGPDGADPRTGWPIWPCYSPLSGTNFEGPDPDDQVIIDETFGVPSLGGSQAKIIFFAACDLNLSMQNFFGINNSTVGRALVFPPSLTDIDLDMGEYEWEQIVAYLESGQNLKLAVASANAKTAKKTWYKQVKGVNTVVPAQAWQVIGDSGNMGAGIQF